MKSLIVIISLFVFLLIAAPAAADVEVGARVDRTTLDPGDTLNLVVSVKNGGGEVDVSAITDFKVIPRGTNTNMQFINGRSTREKLYNYLLIPKTNGRLIIPALAVQSDGALYHTQPITITVNDQPTAGAAAISRDVFVDATLSNKAPYVGQQIIYTFRLHNAVQIADARFQPPEFNGFTAKEVKDRRSVHKVINGREFAAIEIFYVLVPLAPGATTIEPALLQAQVEVPGSHSRQQSPFDRFFDDPRFNRGAMQTRTFRTDTLQVEVQPLPAPDGGANFSGLVGRFELDARLDKAALKVGDSATLAVTIRGQGNIMDAQAIDLDLPAAFKTYADNPEEKIEMDRNGFHGQIIFRTALVPVKAGPVELPPLQLTYFDVTQNSYRTLSATLPALTIGKADNAQGTPITITPAPLGQLKKQVAFTGRDILPPKEGLAAIEHQRPMHWGLFVLILLAPAMLFGSAVLVQRLKRQDQSPAAMMKVRSRQALKAARAEKEAAFLTHLYQALTAAIHAAAGRKGQALTWQEAETLLQQSGCNEQDARQAAQLLTTIESSKFSGARLNADQRSNLLDQVKKMTRKLAP